jgi:hypothetical protein
VARAQTCAGGVDALLPAGEYWLDAVLSTLHDPSSGIICSLFAPCGDDDVERGMEVAISTNGPSPALEIAF